MTLLITNPMLGDIKTISIPTDAIFTVSLLIVFALIGYFFLHILSNDTQQFSQKTTADAKLQLIKEALEDRLVPEITTLEQKKVKKPRIKNLILLPSAKLLGLGSLAAVGIGGASLLGIQSMQPTYESVRTSQTKIKLENQARKHQLSMINLKSFYKQQKNIKTISYMEPFLPTIKNSKDNHDYQVKEKQIENIFSF